MHKIKKFYLKWIVRHCPHNCSICEYYNECDIDIYVCSLSWKELRTMRKNNKLYK